MDEKIYDVVIIGAGASGLNSSLYSSRMGLSVALIERGLYGGQLHNSGEVQNYAGYNSVSGEDLAEDMEAHIHEQHGIEHIYGDVIGLSKKDSIFETTLKKGKVIKSKTTVIATGVKHRKIGIVGEDYKNISNCSICDSMFYKGDDVAVIGGGDSALESVLLLSDIAKSVTLVYHGNKLRAEQILQDRMALKENVKIIWNAETVAITGEKDKATHLVYIDKENQIEQQYLPADGVFVNVGMIPVTEPFKHTGFFLLDEFGYVMNDPQTMETRVKGLFAVGDVRADSVRQIASAVGDGAIAGINIKKYIEAI